MKGQDHASGGKLSRTKRAFEIHADCISLTYKHVGLDKHDIMSRINNQLFDGSLFGAAVSEEKYPNGGIHYHVWIKTKEKRFWTMKTLDYLGGTHGFYTPVRSTPYKNLAYVLKDKNYIITSANDFEEICCQAVEMYGFKCTTLDVCCFNKPKKIEEEEQKVNIKKGKDGIFAGVQKSVTQTKLPFDKIK